MTKPTVYIASPYTRGDVAVNVRFQCKVFDQLLTEGKVLPVVLLWSHFQHLLFPRPYNDWIAYSLELLPVFDCCLRLSSELAELNYSQSESEGADREVAAFKALGKPVFASIAELNAWLEKRNEQ